MVEAVLDKGVIRGSIIGTDRIVRCNPAARHYHLEHPHAKIQYDGRLVDPLEYVREPQPGKNPYLASTLSIVPGLGRVYAGQPVDGLFSFLLVAGFGYNSFTHNQADHTIRAGINGTLMTLFWMADIYGAYRTAQKAPPKNLPP